jgi:hypothetical protein
MRVVLVSVVHAPVLPVWYDCWLCGLPVVFSLIACGVWFRLTLVVQRVILWGLYSGDWLVVLNLISCQCGRHMPSESDRRLGAAEQAVAVDARCATRSVLF